MFPVPRKNKKKGPQPAPKMYDLIIKREGSNMILIKCRIDAHVLAIIEGIIKEYKIRQWAGED
jgi:hypothetical protein